MFSLLKKCVMKNFKDKKMSNCKEKTYTNRCVYRRDSKILNLYRCFYRCEYNLPRHKL